ncbi:replication protein A 70 kDa DNA-binding subunit B-like [Syzygium oleosum]|uniref:replication protein A 70 kDa DNA-binding subunit B-like n=1 Tax=Syzygium oleosum TaxID=219896 RepID=UPI0024BB1C26|nr:replication protein A 70 kDa DNA-binding subunit B-like [Syzygium oleosum]
MLPGHTPSGVRHPIAVDGDLFFRFIANDGKMKLKGILPSNVESEILSGSIQNLGLIRILHYTLNDIPSKSDKYLVVNKCEAVSPALEMEIKSDAGDLDCGILLKPKQEDETNSEVTVEESGNLWKPKQEVEVGNQGKTGPGKLLKPKQEMVAKSAAQIVHEQHRKRVSVFCLLILTC